MQMINYLIIVFFFWKAEPHIKEIDMIFKNAMVLKNTKKQGAGSNIDPMKKHQALF